MPLSNKLKADYIELFNNTLDNIPIKSLDNFNTLARLLEDMVSKQDVKPENVSDDLSSIRGLIQEPELFAKPEDQDEFRDLLILRINSKINELRTLSTTQKEEIIEENIKKQHQVTIKHEIMKRAQPPKPNSPSHTLSEYEWLAELQRDAQSESVTEAPASFIYFWGRNSEERYTPEQFETAYAEEVAQRQEEIEAIPQGIVTQAHRMRNNVNPSPRVSRERFFGTSESIAQFADTRNMLEDFFRRAMF